MELENITFKNYEKYLPFILKSEEVFKESIRLDAAQLARILKADRPIVKAVFYDSRFIGDIIGFCPNEADVKDLEIEGIIPCKNLLYLYNFVIMSIDLKPNSKELGSSFTVLNLGSSRKPTNKPHKVFLIPEFMGRGFGKSLFQDLIATAKNKGYEFLEGHFRQNASLHIAKRNNAEVIKTYTNWNDTGEDYVHCRLRL